MIWRLYGKWERRALEAEVRRLTASNELLRAEVELLDHQLAEGLCKHNASCTRVAQRLHVAEARLGYLDAWPPPGVVLPTREEVMAELKAAVAAGETEA